MDKYNVDLKFDRKTLKFGKSPNTCEFIDFHLDNPKVWELYLQFASDMVHHGHKKLSSEMLINRVRWETMVNTTDKQFKINNNHKPYYARLLLSTQRFKNTKFLEVRQSCADDLSYSECEILMSPYV
tara:strand:- start:1042 stop:1422 length:381 start_codon:yes stop_codon:yes gene_type:complete